MITKCYVSRNKVIGITHFVTIYVRMNLFVFSWLIARVISRIEVIVPKTEKTK
jgi:hypothetical protein